MAALQAGEPGPRRFPSWHLLGPGCPAPIPEILITTQRKRLFLDYDSLALLCFVFLKTIFSGPKSIASKATCFLTYPVDISWCGIYNPLKVTRNCERPGCRS